MRQILSALITVLSLALVVTGCDDDGCGDDEPCECSDVNECVLGCHGDDCNVDCHNTVHCDGVCEDDCSFACHDMNDCSVFCGNDCSVDCHNTVSCGVICGERCDYRCHDIDRCGVEVGPGSSVECANVTSCVVECTGNCQVSCSRAVNRCEVTCPDGKPATTCSDGIFACGPC